MYVCRLNPDADGIIGTGVKFQRIRRITGYLVGTLDRFNNAKRAEEHDRAKHMHLGQQPTFKAVQEPKPPAQQYVHTKAGVHAA